MTRDTTNISPGADDAMTLDGRNIETFLRGHLAGPLTHRVTTLYADGNAKTHATRSLGAANNYAIGERRKIGRDLIDRASGKTVRIVAVTVEAL